MHASSGAWIVRGEKVDAAERGKEMVVQPTGNVGQTVAGGQILGEVAETVLIKHRVLVPPDVSGTLQSLAPGEYTIRDVIAVVETPAGTRELTMAQNWPVRMPRPIQLRRRVTEPLVTGQRIIDALFPIGKGGAAAIPGGFGTGKTITQHSWPSGPTPI
jgi:V/A-type H+/Na+-transporting ATPase subunit A